MDTGGVSDVTRFLDGLADRDSRAGADLLPLVYNELRRLAAARMANEPPGHTLQPTALVHEAWLRVASTEATPAWNGRAHFFAAASEAMRRILVERARRRQRLKRGAGAEHLALEDEMIAAPMDDVRILQVHEALARLATEDPMKVEIVKMKFFVGLANAEIAAVLDVNEKTVRRHWEVAKVRLFREIQDLNDPPVA